MSAWHGHDVPAVAALLAEDHADAWRQVAAWHRTADLLLYHADTLTGLRERVAAAWPPERSPAAAAYVDHLDGLVASVAGTRAAALANGAALAGILSTLEDARTRVEAVNREWQWNAATGQRPEGILMPRAPNVTPQWRQTLNQRVHEQMTAVDQAVFEYTNQLAVPLPYDRRGPTNEDLRATGGAPARNPAGHIAEPAGGETGMARHAISAALPNQLADLGPQLAGDPVQASGEREFSAGPTGSAAAALPPQGPSAAATVAASRRVLPEQPTRSAVGRNSPGGRANHEGRVARPSPTAGPVPRDAGPPDRRRENPRRTSSAAEPAPEIAKPAVPAQEARTDGARVPPAAGVVGSAGVVPSGVRPHARPQQRRRWPVPSGVEPIITPHRAIERFHPGPGVIGLDR